MLFVFFSPGVSIKKNSSQPIMLQAEKDKVWNIIPRITCLMFKLFCVNQITILIKANDVNNSTFYVNQLVDLLTVCLSFFLSAIYLCVSVCLSVSWFVCVPVCLCAHLYAFLPLCLYLVLLVCLFFVTLSVCLSACISVSLCHLIKLVLIFLSLRRSIDFFV